MPGQVVMRDLMPGNVDETDVQAAVEIALAAWEPIFAAFRAMMGDDLFTGAYPDWRAFKEGQVRDALHPGDGALVSLAELDGDVVGFITAYTDAQTGIAELGNNAVHPAYQGRGIGPTMHEHMFGRLRAAGMEIVKVTTGGDPSHAPARRAYEKSGFVVQVPTVTYYRPL